MNNGYVLIFLTALGFGVWPMIGKASGASPAWMSVIVMGVTALFAGIVQPKELAQTPSSRQIFLLIVAGIINGVGMLAYGRLLDGNGKFPVSTYVTASLLLCNAVLFLGGLVFFNEAITWQKTIGVVLAFTATMLLTK